MFNKPTLTCLPTELHAEIVDHIRNDARWDDLCALSLSCSRFRHIAQKALYNLIEISHQIRQLNSIHTGYESEVESDDEGLDEESVRAAMSSPTLDHPLKTLASDMTKHRNLLHHVRTLTIDCGCNRSCEHHVLVIQIANLFLDHLSDMTGLRTLELKLTPILEPAIYRSVIALAGHSLQDVTLDLVYPQVVSLPSLINHDLEPFLCTVLDIYMDTEDLFEFYAGLLNRCQRLTTLILRGDILELVTSIKSLVFRRLDQLEVQSKNPELAEPLSAFLQGNPSITDLCVCIPDAVGSDIILSAEDLPVLRSIRASPLVMGKLVPGRPVVNIRSDLRNKDYKAGQLSQLIEAVGLSSAKVIKEFSIVISAADDLERTLEKILNHMKSVKDLKLHNLPPEDEVILDFVRRIEPANFANLETLSLTRAVEIPDQIEGTLQRSTLQEDQQAFRPFLLAVHQRLPSVVAFTITCGRTEFTAERDGQNSLEDGGWWIRTSSLLLSEIPA